MLITISYFLMFITPERNTDNIRLNLEKQTKKVINELDETDMTDFKSSF